MRQYLDIKDGYPDALVMFRCGDFYEMFFEDAVVAARLLDLTLTSRDKGKEDAVPMCGVPWHAGRGYIAKLTELGRKVVIAEQMEDPKLAKGLVKREVVRVVTPGIVLDDEVLEPKCARYVCALVPSKEVVALAYLDATTGELAATQLSPTAVLDELARVAPREVLVAPELLGDSVRAQVVAGWRERYKVAWNPAPVPSDAAARTELGTIVIVEPTGRSGVSAIAPSVSSVASAPARPPVAGAVVAAAPMLDRDLVLRAAATVVAYARATQPTGTLPVTSLRIYWPEDSVVLDETAIANLELVETLIGKHKQGSLLEVIDETVTAPGGRLLRRWLLYPLVDVAQIRRRQDAIEWLVERPALADQIRAALAQIADLERLAGKATLGVATPRDLGKLRDALGKLPELTALVASGRTKLAPIPQLIDPGIDPGTSKRATKAASGDARTGLAACAHDALPALCARLAAALVDEPPPLLDPKHGGVIRTGYDAQVDECRRLADGGKDEILAIEEREQKQSGIASLKVRYNRVFGYYIEITKSHLAKVPAHYIRKQTVATGERYVTSELAELEKKVLTAEETLVAREAELFRVEVGAVAAIAKEIAAAGAALAVLDACSGLASVAAHRNYVRPVVDEGTAIDIVDGRHPVIERMLPASTFVPNDCKLDSQAEQLVLITGPNMAGKSTYMRQVAQIVLLAQMGGFVPAKSATIGLCDRVFTRVGAADNLSRGDSTFMVEMRETAQILAKATERSLVILDEVGRGTSTFDGVSIAWAVAEHLHDKIRARTLFATHYHELVALADSRPHVRNVSVAVREHKNEIVFLRRVVPGGANKSYGIDVARLAGLPKNLIARSRQIMSQLEGGSQLGGSAQLSLLPAATVTSPVLAKLAAISIDRTTPLEALQLLAELKSLV